jgi:serine/threonine protein kinase
MIRVLVVEPGREPRYVTLRQGSGTVGRSRRCDLALPAVRGLSRFHCRLRLSNGSLFVEDLGARNLTLVNGRPVRASRLDAGDRLELGGVELRIEDFREEEATPEWHQACVECGHLYAAGRGSCPRCARASLSRTSRAIASDSIPGFLLRRRIGAGGMGIVFEAEEVAARRLVAMKILRPHLARDLAYLSRFLEEMRLLTALRHPAIVEVHGRGVAGDLHYFVMELVEGRSARDLLRTAGRLPARDAVGIIAEAARALNAAHQQAGIVHGDVKPANFLLPRSGGIKLCDFGIARVDLVRRDPDRAAEAEALGTAAYAAPERFREGGRPDVASDIYALGVSLFQLASGVLPYRGGDAHSLRRAHAESPVPLLRQAGVEAPAVQMLVERMMAKDPARRPRDYRELLDDLALVLS